MDLHDQIMNLPAPDDITIAGIVTDGGNREPSAVYAYKCGHRDARHAAAELATQADARIAELEAQLKQAQLSIDSLRAHVATERRLAEGTVDALSGYRNEGELPECAIRRMRAEFEAARASEWDDLKNNMPDEFGD